MARIHRTTALLIAAALGAGSCGVLPDDHGLQQAIGQATRRMIDSVGSLSRAVDNGGRDLDRLANRLAGAPSAAARELGRLQDAGRRLAADGTDRLVRFWPRTERFVAESAEQGVRRLASLTEAPARIGVRAERNLGDLRRSLAAAPSSVLRLDRTPMVEPEDPERTVEIEPTARRRSWLERILDRIAF